MANPQHRICAHNGQEFDFPYIARRTLINGLKLPPVFDIAGAKPWEIRECLLDTLQLWKFGDYKHYTSLDLLCTIFNIPTPKDDIDGSQVGDVFYKEADYTRIARYCEKDTLAVAQLLLRYKGDPIIPQENFEIV
jgi:DNA polymerase elongation subunit (family B)